jgi:hypothetical protein
MILAPLGVMRLFSTATCERLYGMAQSRALLAAHPSRLSRFRPKGRERLYIGTVRIARREHEQPALALAANEHEAVIRVALGLPAIGLKALDSGRHGAVEIRGRLKALNLNNLVLHVVEHDIGRLAASGVGIMASATHAPTLPPRACGSLLYNSYSIGPITALYACAVSRLKAVLRAALVFVSTRTRVDNAKIEEPVRWLSYD